MDIYEIKGPDGAIYEIQGDHPPSDEEIQAIFAEQKPPSMAQNYVAGPGAFPPSAKVTGPMVAGALGGGLALGTAPMWGPALVSAATSPVGMGVIQAGTDLIQGKPIPIAIRNGVGAAAGGKLIGAAGSLVSRLGTLAKGAETVAEAAPAIKATEKVAEKVVPIASGRASRVFQTLAQRAARRAGATQAAGIGSEAVSAGKIAPRASSALPEAFQESTAAVASKIPAPVMHGKGAQASKEVLEAAGDKLFDQIQNWKTVQKFSDGQVAKILKEMYGVGGSDAKVMIKEVMKNVSN